MMEEIAVALAGLVLGCAIGTLTIHFFFGSD